MLQAASAASAAWSALLQPGLAEQYFIHPALPAFQPESHAYSPANAWWLAELSRLIYRQGPDEGRPASPSRAAILAGVGLQEWRFFNHGSTQAALMRCHAPARFAVLVFRGSQDVRDWLANLQVLPAPWPNGGWVHSGFQTALDAVWMELAEALARLDEPIFYTGHSLGGALAILAAARRPPRALYTFGAPKVGNPAFQRCLAGVAHYRLVNHRDIVPTLPPGAGPLAFGHAGEAHFLSPGNGASVNPPDSPVRALGKLWDWLQTSAARNGFDPPGFLADHAPINYVTRLADLAG